MMLLLSVKARVFKKDEYNALWFYYHKEKKVWANLYSAQRFDNADQAVS